MKSHPANRLTVNSLWPNLLAIVALGLCLVASPTLGQTTTDNRSVWRFSANGKPTSVEHQGGKKWILEWRPDFQVEWEETARTPEYIELLHSKNGGIWRLYSGRSKLLKKDAANWRVWWKGDWDVKGKPPTKITQPAAKQTRTADDYRIKLAYFVPKDRKPDLDYEAKIRMVSEVISDFYKFDLQSKGYKKAGLKFEMDGEQPKVHLIKGSEPARHYNNYPNYDADEQWKMLLPEIKSSVGVPNENLILVFAETQDKPQKNGVDYTWPGHLARGAYYSTEGGMAIVGAVCLRDEYCKTNVAAQMRHVLQMNPTVAKSTMGRFGAAAHELGHALGLPHDMRNSRFDVMGQGFRNFVFNLQRKGSIRFSEENARLLMASRFVNPELNLSDGTPPILSLQLSETNRKGAELSVIARDDEELGAIAFYDRRSDSLFGGRKLKGTDATFKQKIPLKMTAAGPLHLRVILTDLGGNQTKLIIKSGDKIISSD